MIPIVIAVLQNVATPGINLVGLTLLLQFIVSFGFILVVNAPQNMVACGTETFAARDFVKTGLVLTAIAYALVLVLGVTYWRWLGFVRVNEAGRSQHVLVAQDWRCRQSLRSHRLRYVRLPSR